MTPNSVTWDRVKEDLGKVLDFLMQGNHSAANLQYDAAQYAYDEVLTILFNLDKDLKDE